MRPLRLRRPRRAAVLPAADWWEERVLRRELEDLIARDRGGHRCFDLEIAPGQFARVNGDPNMDAQTAEALATMFRLAYEQATRGGPL